MAKAIKVLLLIIGLLTACNANQTTYSTSQANQNATDRGTIKGI